MTERETLSKFADALRPLAAEMRSMLDGHFSDPMTRTRLDRWAQALDDILLRADAGADTTASIPVDELDASNDE